MADKRSDATSRNDPARATETTHQGDALAKGLRGVDYAADRAARAVSEAADQARDKFDRAMDGVKRGAERARDGVHSSTGRVEESLDETQERVAETREAMAGLGERTARDIATDVEDLVREHPGKALLIAGVCGFILGSLAARGRD